MPDLAPEQPPKPGARKMIRETLRLLRRGPNARKDMGPEEDARALWRSRKIDKDCPIVPPIRSAAHRRPIR